MSRHQFNWTLGSIGALFGVFSLIVGLCAFLKVGPPGLQTCGPYLIGIWILVPPLFFWVDWVYFSDELNTPELRDVAKHTHDLSRNIWIALTAVLAYLFHVVEFPGIGH